MSSSRLSKADQLLRRLLRELREKQNRTQVQLAESLRLPQSFVSKYELGERRLDFVETLMVCEALGISPNDFLEIYLEELPKISRSDE